MASAGRPFINRFTLGVAAAGAILAVLVIAVSSLRAADAMTRAPAVNLRQT
jgi:hypothetical protein